MQQRSDWPRWCLATGMVVGESGIFQPSDVARLAAAGVGAVLVGESLMRQADVEAATRALLNGESRAFMTPR